MHFPFFSFSSLFCSMNARESRAEAFSNFPSISFRSVRFFLISSWFHGNNYLTVLISLHENHHVSKSNTLLPTRTRDYFQEINARAQTALVRLNPLRLNPGVLNHDRTVTHSSTCSFNKRIFSSAQKGFQTLFWDSCYRLWDSRTSRLCSTLSSSWTLTGCFIFRLFFPFIQNVTAEYSIGKNNAKDEIWTELRLESLPPLRGF